MFLYFYQCKCTFGFHKCIQEDICFLIFADNVYYFKLQFLIFAQTNLFNAFDFSKLFLINLFMLSQIHFQKNFKIIWKNNALKYHPN